MRILLTVGLKCAQLTDHVDWGTYACWTVASWHSRKVLYTHTHDLTGVDGDISDCDVLRRPAWSNPDCSAWQCQRCNTLKCQVCDLHRRLCAIKSESSQLLARYINSHLYQKLIYETLDFNSPCTQNILTSQFMCKELKINRFVWSPPFRSSGQAMQCLQDLATCRALVCPGPRWLRH